VGSSIKKCTETIFCFFHAVDTPAVDLLNTAANLHRCNKLNCADSRSRYQNLSVLHEQSDDECFGKNYFYDHLSL